jgi:hypothetical protein
MSAIANDRNELLDAAPVRDENPRLNKSISLASDAVVFQVASGGAGTPTTITLTAVLLGMVGTVAFGTAPVTTLGVTGNEATLDFADMGADSVVITASITVNGELYEAVQTITKVFDGTGGAPGQAAVSSQLTSSSAIFAANSTGLVDVGQTFPTTMTVLLGIVDDTSNWTITRASSDVSITTTILGALVTVTGMGTLIDSGYVDVTATRLGYPTQVMRPVPDAGVMAALAGMDASLLVAGGVAAAGVKFFSDGDIQQNSSGSYVSSADWYDPNTVGIGSTHYIKVTRISAPGTGALGGTLGAWQDLSATRTFTLTQSVIGADEQLLFVQISSDATGVPVLGTGYSTLYAERT